ncbi:MAG: hypothetical protein MK132_17090 [Lentisphaerales bacterium]|nr:hypothetical protein [Lentisphaerales bacterium]
MTQSSPNRQLILLRTITLLKGMFILSSSFIMAQAIILSFTALLLKNDRGWVVFALLLLMPIWALLATLGYWTKRKWLLSTLYLLPGSAIIALLYRSHAL